MAIKVGDLVIVRINTLVFPGVVVHENSDATFEVFYNNQYIMCKTTTNNLINVLEIDRERKRIFTYYQEKIDELKSKIRNATDEEKDTEKVQKFRNGIERLKKNCEKIATWDLDDDDILNRVGEMNNIKKNLFTEKLDCVSEIRKQNGTIKHEIKRLEFRRNAELKKISDEEIRKRFWEFK